MKQYTGGMAILDYSEMYRIHQAMLAILAEPGLEVQLPADGLRLLAEAGLSVDMQKRRVRFPPETVLETIRQFSGAASPQVNENGTDRPLQPRRLPTRVHGTIGTTHGFVFDLDKRQMRPATRQDFITFSKIARRLEDVSPVVGMLPQDVPQEVAYIHRAALNAKYNRSTGGVSANGPDDGIWVTRVLQTAGLLSADAPPISSSHMQLTGALVLSARAAEDTLRQARQGQLTYIATCGFLGGNHPVTIPGALAMVYAENFGCNTISRLLTTGPANRFRPRAIGNDHLIMDMRRADFCVASPEGQMIRLAMRQMSGEFYRFPGGSGFIVSSNTDCPEPGVQAALEWALGITTELMGGFYSYDEEVTATVKSLGRVHANLALNAEQLLVDYEGLQWLRRFFRGPQVDENSLAVAAVREVGPGGDFTSAEHTVANYHQHFWFPALLYRGPWSGYQAAGCPDPLKTAREKIREISRDELEPALSEDVCRALNQVVQKAEKDLLGTTTGVTI